MKYGSSSLQDLLKSNEEKKLVIPNFQRSFVWEEGNKIRLITSYLLGLPIGNILILEGTQNDFAARDLCSEMSLIPKEDCLFLLDGQQRISTLKSIFSDSYSDDPDKWKDTWEMIFSRLRKRWFIKTKPSNGQTDIFDYETLNFEASVVNSLEPSMVEDLLICENLFVKNNNKWFHPAYRPLDRNEKVLSRRLKRNEIVRTAAMIGYIPIHEVFISQKTAYKPLHRLTIERIGAERAKELQDLFEHDKNKVISILERVEPEIKDIVEENNKEILIHAWTSLHIKWANDVSNFIEDILKTKIAEIKLPSSEIHRAFAIFEEINRGGTPLDEYDLIVAKAARQTELQPLTKRIRNLIKSDRLSLTGTLTHHIVANKIDELDISTCKILENNELTKYFKRQYLNLLSIFSHHKYGEYEISRDKVKKLTIGIEHIKREKILSIPFEKINENTERTVLALKRTIAFLNIRCGIIGLPDLQYQLMALPIAYSIIDDEVWNSKKSLNKIEFWYWASLFSGAYQYDQNRTAISDITDLFSWIKIGHDKMFQNRLDGILKATKFSNLDVLLGKDEDNPPGGAIRNGILQYVLSNQPRDFLDESVRLSAWEVSEEKEISYRGKLYTLKVQDHHICPLGGVTKIGESTKEFRSQKNHILNSPLNRTYISAMSNLEIRSRSPEDYFNYVSESAKFGHCIPTPIDTKFLKSDDESDDVYYERVLTERYYELYKEIKQELEHLIA